MGNIIKYKVVLTKLDSVENPFIEPNMQYVQPNEVKQLISQNLPEEGQEFYATYEKGFRFFRTSTVKKILEVSDDKMIFETWNSKYQLDIGEKIIVKELIIGRDE